MIGLTIILIVLGVVVGFISGLLGVGGGFILVPVFTTLFSLTGLPPDTSIKMAVGTSLLTVFLTSIVSAYKHHLRGNTLWRCALVLGVFGIIGSLIGLKISMEYLSGEIHRRLFAILLILTSIYGIYLGERDLDKWRDIPSSLHYRKLPVIGILVGVVSTLFGIGGGILTVPLLVYLLRLPIRMAIGTSCAMMLLTSLPGIVGYMLQPFPLYQHLFNIGYVSLIFGSVVGLVAMVSSKYGALLAYKLRSKTLKNIFYLILMLVGIKLLC
ncbi:sulfite exporter TauE/SafE family protein [Methanothermococcus sp. SCGC AD-155-E23]|nr:sulfite exporter TauE/SafE family protein [Methanothermococcus sp. SCGC AD-155-E23]